MVLGQECAMVGFEHIRRRQIQKYFMVNKIYSATEIVNRSICKTNLFNDKQGQPIDLDH